MVFFGIGAVLRQGKPNFKWFCLYYQQTPQIIDLGSALDVIDRLVLRLLLQLLGCLNPR